MGDRKFKVTKQKKKKASDNKLLVTNSVIVRGFKIISNVKLVLDKEATKELDKSMGIEEIAENVIEDMVNVYNKTAKHKIAIIIENGTGDWDMNEVEESVFK